MYAHFWLLEIQPVCKVLTLLCLIYDSLDVCSGMYTCKILEDAFSCHFRYNKINIINFIILEKYQYNR